MKWITLLLIVAALFLPLPAIAQDGSVTVPGFTASQAEIANPITVIGPDEADPGDTVTCRLAGTPTIDLSLPLLDQLAWLIGDDQMFAYVAMPGQSLMPLDVEGTIAFGASGATMRPQVSFGVADAGEYRLLIDWNFAQNQLVEHVVVVGGDQPDPHPGPDPEPNPNPVPLSSLRVLILLEQDYMMEGLEGAQLNQRVEQVKSYLTSLPCLWSIMDRDQPAASPSIAHLKQASVNLPALAVYALDQAPEEPSRFIGGVSLAGGVDEAIAKLKTLGVTK
jgi:hypothetical protein